MDKPNRRILGWPLLALILISVAVVLWQRQAIVDWFRLYGYEPPASVVQLADEISATDYGRHLLYVNRPEIQDRDAFNSSCSRQGEQTIVLGCYHPVDRGIFIFHVTDERLKGVDQVTTAHEMLHAGYERLDAKERAVIDRQLNDYFLTVQDERIKNIIAAYRKTEPNDIPNEMHSIFATEIATLTPDLETYYKKYFKDRAKVVGYANAYQGEFTSRQKQVEAYDSRLAQLKPLIESNTAKLDTQEADITALRRRMEADRGSGDIAAYNANVPVYNSRIDAYNSLIASTRTLINEYNDIVGKRNELALQVTELAHSIDSSFQTL
jgi:hypothetical protein